MAGRLSNISDGIADAYENDSEAPEWAVTAYDNLDSASARREVLEQVSGRLGIDGEGEVDWSGLVAQAFGPLGELLHAIFKGGPDANQMLGFLQYLGAGGETSSSYLYRRGGRFDRSTRSTVRRANNARRGMGGRRGRW